MAKLILLALAFTALVAFASAERTITTTTFFQSEEEQGSQQCSQELSAARFNECQKYLQPGFSLIPWLSTDNPQQCCNELNNINQECQCEAVQEAFWRSAHNHQGGFLGSAKVQQLRQKAQQLPNQCNLRMQQQCRIPSIVSTTTTFISEDVNDRSSGSQWQQCQHVQQQSFNQCQKYVQQQIRSQGSISMRSQQQPQNLQQCCNELENVQQQCQCDALQQVIRQVQQQQMQQQGSSQRGQQQQQPQLGLQQVVQTLRNKCNIQVQQCSIPSAMF